MSEAAITVRKASFTRDGFTVLNDVSVDFPAGRTTLLLGPSGSGKTTLLKIAAGLFPPDRGRARYRGVDLTAVSGEQERELRRELGFAFQDGALWQNMTVFQNLALPLQYHYPRMLRREMQARIDRLVSGFPIRRHMELRPAALSAGERKIVSFLRALVLDPRVLFFDEPTSSVDNQSAERIENILADRRRRGVTLIGISHNAQLTARLADYLLIMIGGAVRAFGPVRQVAATGDREVQTVLSDVLADAASFDGDILELLDGADGEP
ncbi:MAG: ATP-binding cassette domain-containing protein [Spirochaetaceae bacterium]|nr:MAG: ATP-binding cassette domain-containing protein [Spirochaetaceae bacterium]